MKKIFCALMCLILAMFMLVGCAEDVIGDYLDQYEPPIPKEKLEFNLYIICEEGTEENAKVTVNQRIADYTADKFQTKVNVIYVTADAYRETISAKSAADAEKRADIFLVTSKAMYDDLMSLGRLADLTDLFADKTFGTLNAQIAESVIKTSLESVTVDGKTVSKNYCVPNNHVVGTYEYLVINRTIAERYYQGSESKLSTFTTYESTSSLRDLISADITGGVINGEVADYVKVVNGMYEDKAKFESEGYWCNVIGAPTATVEDTFSSAFVVNSAIADVSRAMEIIFAINNDTTLRNYLQFGIAGTNYNLDANGKVVRTSTGNSVYYMNPLYTGDIFMMLYCEELGWTADAYRYGEIQNRDSVEFTPDSE